MSELAPLPCCRDHAIGKGLEPSMAILCPNCSDYRGFMKYIRYPEDQVIYRPPPGFRHMTYDEIMGSKDK